MGFGPAQGSGFYPLIEPDVPSVPSAIPGAGIFFTDDVGARQEAFYEDDLSAVTQMTSAGALNGAAVGFGAGAANRVVVTTAAGLATTDAQLTYDTTTDILDLTGSFRLSTDVQLSRGAADRLDLAAGDTLNLVAGLLSSNAGASPLTVNATALISPNATSSNIVIQTQTFTAGAAHNALVINPTWAAENFNHTAVAVLSTQNGANSSALGLMGITVSMTKATAATTLAVMSGIGISSPSVTGTVTTSSAVAILDQTNAGITTPRGVLFNATGVANSVQFGVTTGPIFYGQAAQTLRLVDSTNVNGLSFVLASGANQIVNTVSATTGQIVLQSQVFTAGATSRVVTVSPTWAAEDFEHTGLSLEIQQNGANSSTLQAIRVFAQKATGATTLANMYGISVVAPSVTGTVTNASGLIIQNQSTAGGTTSYAINIVSQTANATTTRAVEIAGTGVNNAVRLGSSANIYASAAEDVRFMDSTNARGIALTLTAAGTQTVSATGGDFAFSAGAAERARILSTGEPLWGTAALPAAGDFGAFRRDQNASTPVRINNQNSGTASQAQLICSTDASSLQVGATSSGFTTSGLKFADACHVLGDVDASGGLAVGTLGLFPLIFGTNNVDRGRILSGGGFIHGATSMPVASDWMATRLDQNAVTVFRVNNQNAGTASRAELICSTDASSLSCGATASGFTPNGLRIADAGYVLTEADASGGLTVGAIGSQPLIFGTNNVEVARFTATGIAQFAPPAQSSGTTAILNITSAINTAGAVPYFSVTGAASTGQTLSTEIAFANFNLAQTVTWATGALTTERAFLVQAPTLAFAAASTVTNAITASITAACGAGSNATITNSFVLQVGGAATVGATAAGTIYGAVDVPSHTITYTGTTQITSVGPAGIRIGTLTITDASAVTIDTAAALYIAAAPAQGGSVTLTASYSIWADAGPVRFDDHVRFGAGVAVVAGQYSVGRDADGTNQLHMNVPTGASFECSVNDVAKLVLNSTNLQPGANGDIALGLSGTAFAHLFLASGGVINWNAANVTLTQAASALTLASAAASSGSPTLWTVTGAAHTTLAASAEATDVNFNLARTVQFATGALTTQRAYRVQGPTYGFVAASTLTTATTMTVEAAPAAGTNATLTNAFALQVGGAVNTGATSAGFIYGAVDIPSHTLTVTGTTQITSVGPAGIRIGTLTITDASAVTIDTAAALYIAAAPAQAGSVTLTRGYSVWADAGLARFDGGIELGAEPAGRAGTVSYTNTVDNTANSTGIGTIKFKGATSRDSSGFLKVMDGTTARFIPYFDAITG